MVGVDKPIVYFITLHFLLCSSFSGCNLYICFLGECNVSLYNNVSNHSRQSLLNGIKALNSINQQLLVTQIQVQDSATSLSKAFDNIAKLDEKLSSVLATPYIPEINIL